jgi:hypothetical protein
MHDIHYDALHDEVLVTNPFAPAILVYRGGVNGEEAPIRVIQGPHTGLQRADRVEVDAVNNEIFVPDGEKILVFPRTGNGDVAPSRTLTPWNGDPAVSVVADPVNDILVVGLGRGNAKGGLLVFKRNASENTKPRGVIQGPKTEIVRIQQMQVSPQKGWIVATQAGKGDEQEPEGVFVGIWNIKDHGDIPPRWKIGGPNSGLKKPRGVALNFKYKELIIADMRLNSVLTYSFPEIF